MKRAMFIVLLVAVLLTLVAPLAMTAKADGPWGYGGYGYGYVFPGSGYNKVCMYATWNCSYRFVPPYPVSGYYLFPYNTYFKPKVYNPCCYGGMYGGYGGYGGY